MSAAVAAPTPAPAKANGRNAHARAVLGPELSERLPATKVLLVGAGGIGCELLKNLVLTGFGHITLLDLDTIDLSNLNRQFLFRKKDVKKSKALTAAQTAGPFNPSVRIHPIHGNIKDAQFDMDWFASFDIVLNALDNLDARRHVNKMCMATGVPLVESGTAGYLGQVQPLLKDRTECFDCIPKPTPKTFPVCTIRSTPSQPIHCIVWAKSYLLGQLFGEDEDAGGELDEAEKQGENAQEIATLRREAQAFRAVRGALRARAESAHAAKMAFEKVFGADIRNLLSMADMWRAREPPVPLEFEAIREGGFVLRGVPAASAPADGARPSREPAANGASANGHASQAGLKDQRALTLQENLALFVSSTERLAARLRAGEETIAFDKDDDDTLDFVTAAANLRAAAYNIPGKSRWEVKEMAGNIIPAIATTNAVVAGLIVLQALQLLKKAYNRLRNVHLQFKPNMPISTVMISPPNAGCGVCRSVYTRVQCDTARVTLGEVVGGILGAGEGEGAGREVSVYEDKRVLSDPEWGDNDGRTLESLGVTRGKFLAIVDEEGEYATVEVGICNLPPNHTGGPLILPSPLPAPPRKVKVAAPPPSTPPPKKRPAPVDDDVVEMEPAAKRAKTNGNGAADTKLNPNLYTPSKKRRLDEDGLVMLDSANEKVEDDDVIEID
ncbi:hypothetical protein GLOTRDRAFT_81057 [Gloeophyllum trabeum ATCC 11539]|uniref:Ubiquitin-activating enzyme E1-like n=1 Tax=Gloeophyllum trabeum (strain ATCC 11539 / FP-39264 / Madison 617) TaxID=670483 RepID=S7PVB7_GLOTA|nr:uncharacterized protein GLOTRDRAFT_81057 [Gloeophyllum trabeum ATCC 11539]EPQ51473.1 hypothetical protein GLOTRDRAFT_81057 [Gloeophyllum trabeum ATCC 11539]